MSLIEKSEQNLKASELLIQHKYFNTSIHAAYYAVYQVIILINTQVGSLNTNTNDKQNSHKNTINNLKQNLKEHHDINKIIYNLHIIRKSRTEADYKDKLIKEEDAKKIYNISQKLREKLLDLYNKI